jgi:hypothetical protein
MHIPIDNQHVVNLTLLGRHTGRNCDIVHQTKTHSSLCERVVARGTNKAKRLVVWATGHTVNRITSSSDSQPCHRLGSGGNNRIWIELTSTLLCRLAKPGKVILAMNLAKLCERCRFPTGSLT